MVTTIVESKSKCSFQFVHRALELARRRGEIIDDTDEDRLEWQESEGKQRLNGKVWSFWNKLEIQKRNSETLWFVMPCCAASGSAGRINPWSVWIRSWEVSKIGRKKATLHCPRHRFCSLVRLSLSLLWHTKMQQASININMFVFRSGRKRLGGPTRCDRSVLLGFCASRGVPWSAQATPRSGAPNRNQRTRSGTRDPPMDSRMDYMLRMLLHGTGTRGFSPSFSNFLATDLLFDSFTT